MSIEDYHPTKLFTLDDANKMLPLVRAITKDVVRLARDMLDRRQRLDYLKRGRDLESGDPYGDELRQMETELERDHERLDAFVNELRNLGLEIKGLADGLIDFPSMMDGRLVFLCWKHGESEIQHWHEIDSGFAGRQPLGVAISGK